MRTAPVSLPNHPRWRIEFLALFGCFPSTRCMDRPRAVGRRKAENYFQTFVYYSRCRLSRAPKPLLAINECQEEPPTRLGHASVTVIESLGFFVLHVLFRLASPAATTTDGRTDGRTARQPNRKLIKIVKPFSGALKWHQFGLLRGNGVLICVLARGRIGFGIFFESRLHLWALNRIFRARRRARTHVKPRANYNYYS